MLKNTLKKIVAGILEWEAKLILKKYQPTIIGITGSVGKTSAKEAIFAVLRTKYKVRQSAKSYNSELGVPLTIINRPTAWRSLTGWLQNIFEGLALIIFPNRYPDYLVLEIGADRPGDIKKIARWLKPATAVITRLPDVPVHIEFFKTKESLIQEKLSLAKAVRKDGVVILNIDDDNIRPIVDSLETKVLTYGFNQQAEVWASDDHIRYDGDRPDGLAYKLNYQGRSVPVRVRGAIGRHHIYTTLAACAVGLTHGLNEVEIAEAIGDFATPPGRMRLIPGIKDTLIIDDTYNASPAAVEAGLLTAAEVKIKGRQIAVLADMLELGEYTIEAHKQIGKLLAGQTDLLLLVGLRAKFIAEGAMAAGLSADKINYFDDATAAGKYLQNLIKAGDLIYIKGSQSMRMEKAVEEIMAEPERKAELLCRQETEWRNR
ncbi:MAG: UDP-N-acetylmuramoyl-tripeptide--D-alanyl-D-alanine ligase [Candidatus Paceibacterota bacterium]